MEDCTKLLAKTEGKEGSKKYIFVIQTTFGRDYTLQAASETGTQNTHASHTPDHAPPNTQNARVALSSKLTFSRVQRAQSKRDGWRPSTATTGWPPTRRDRSSIRCRPASRHKSPNEPCDA
jgi:hypothetical protein